MRPDACVVRASNGAGAIAFVRRLLVLAMLVSGTVGAQAMPATTVSSAGGLDVDWILNALARPAPMRTAFVELRDSPMLKAPMRLSGEYRRPDGQTLVRQVVAPYRETTTLRAGEATIVRDGKAPRTYSLARVPELADLQAGFGALLAGDRARIEQRYATSARGDRRRWTLVLTPKDKGLASRVREITLYGQGAELRCIETHPVKGALQRTLLASAALALEPQSDAKTMEALCRVGAH